MSITNAITSVHVEKLSHRLEEIRVRALDNIISKLDHGFGCDCDAVKRELVSKIFNWFAFETVPYPDKVLNLLHRLIATNVINPSLFGKLRFQNELGQLRKRLDPVWHDKLYEIEEAVLQNASSALETMGSNESRSLAASITYRKNDPDNKVEETERRVRNDDNPDNHEYDKIKDQSLPAESLNDTMQLDLTLPSDTGTPMSRKTEGAIRWLVMPWQPLVSSDRGVLSAIEDALNNNTDTGLIIRTCEFVTNVMLQDFPAEVFLQRPSIVMILQNLLEACIQESKDQVDFCSIVPVILRTFYKLTRSLRFRIYYYCDPSVANRRQRDLGGRMDSSQSSEDRESSEGGLPEANYQAYQSAATSDRSQSVTDNVDESVLQLQQMLIPNYCIEVLSYALKLLTISDDSLRPLKDVKNILDLSWELVQLLTVSVMPSIWFSSDGLSLKIHENLKLLLKLIGDVLEYCRSYSTADNWRITYLRLLCIVTKLLSSLVPLELAEYILPSSLKISMCVGVMDAPIYLMYPDLNVILQEYARQFRDGDELQFIKLFDETRLITKSMKAAILLLKTDITHEHVNVDTLRTMYTSKSCLSYHKNLSIIKKYIFFMQNLYHMKLEKEEKSIAVKLVLYLLANGDEEIRLETYKECHWLVSSTLGVEPTRGRHNWTCVAFLFEPSILTEIICHGVTDDKTKSIAEDILLYFLKGKLQMGDGWLVFLEALTQVLPLLQCLAEMKSSLGQCVSKMFDPDIATSIQLPHLEVLKGNARYLFSSDGAIREEAACRLIYLLGTEKNSSDKLPHLASLHGLPLGSLLILDRQVSFKKIEGSYQRSSLLSVVEMLKTKNVEPKVRKSALVQISVMLTDSSLHKLFLKESGFKIILDIFDKSLIEKDYENYPDSVIPILTIIKLIISTQCSIRHELSTRTDVFVNILRSLFLFPNHECVKQDVSYLLFALLYNEFMMRLNSNEGSNLNYSLPHIIISKMNSPFICKTHWKSSIHRKSDTSILYSNNPLAVTFMRQYWSWEWNSGTEMLWVPYENLNDPGISNTLMIREPEFALFKYTSIRYCCNQQLLNIKNSTAHEEVMCAIDYLWMYMRFCSRLKFIYLTELTSLPWESTFERFLLSHPVSKEDCDLFVDVLNFLYININITHDPAMIGWLSKTFKNITKSLSDLLQTLDTHYQDVHQSVLKLVRSCCNLEKIKQPQDKTQNMWNDYIELIIVNLCSSDQQHFYNLVYLDWLLTCLTYLTSKSQCNCHKDLLISSGNALIELIISFHGNGALSFMGLSITRNSIICLNHLLFHMQAILPKSSWTSYWFGDGKTLSWLPTLWKNRDPLVRASALQLLGGLIKAPHIAQQLLHALAMAPSELCQTILKFVINHEESSIVREHACIVLSNLIKNSVNSTFKYIDSLRSNAILIYIEQMNVYYEICLLCCNLYLPVTLDPELVDNGDDDNKHDDDNGSESSKTSLFPRNVLQFYNCHDELLMLSVKDSMDDNFPQFLSTPSLITSVCTFLNNLINVGERDVINKIYEHSLDKYLVGCFGSIPKTRKNIKCHDVLEMYINICILLTNCVKFCSNFASAVNFSPDFFYLLFSYLDKNNQNEEDKKYMELRNKLSTEVFNFISVLSLTENQHLESLRSAIEIAAPDIIIKSLCDAINNVDIELRMSGVACLGFLLSQEIDREEEIKCGIPSLGVILDSTFTHMIKYNKSEGNLRDVLSNVNKIALKNSSRHSKKSHDGDDDTECLDEEKSRKCILIGSEICKSLVHLLIAHNYAKSKINVKRARDKDLIIGALSNLICVSDQAKATALEDNLGGTCVLILKELYFELNLHPLHVHRTQLERDKRLQPLLSDVNRVVTLLMNFSHNNQMVKCTLSKLGLADILHKLWAWISLNDSTIVSSLKLLATYTTNCLEAAQSLILTTTLPGTGPRKTPNTVSLIHVIVHLVSKEIDKAAQHFDNQRLQFSFHVLKNAVHAHDCRVSIIKSNLLQFLTKIHPSSTKRAKPWPLVEVYCLEFLIDFTFYEEGQMSVSKAVDGLDVLIQLSRCTTPATRILALSTLRNLLFNVSNRPRVLCSVDFMNLLHSVFKSGSLCEIGIASSMLWSLIANNQKGKLIARSAGLSHSIQEVLGRLTLMPEEKHEQDLAKMLQYIIRILSTSEIVGAGDSND
ncbi:rotatin [Microplitis demolitor]|uniref:rotatin n=1 Tax=Microplitis demolitor TaxID=69319 RepID=UPI0004CD9DFC|nr:rotatin [Microplitis demolitor]